MMAKKPLPEKQSIIVPELSFAKHKRHHRGPHHAELYKVSCKYIAHQSEVKKGGCIAKSTCTLLEE